MCFDRVNGRSLMISGLMFLPAFVLQTSLAVRFLQVSAVLVLYVLSGKRLRIIYPLMLIVSVTAVNLLRPAGEVLFNVSGFPVTLDALKSGMSRALLLTGLVYVSRLCVSSVPSFPGRWGRMLSMVFFFFGRMTSESRGTGVSGKVLLHPFRNFTGYFDRLLFLSGNITPDEGPAGGKESRKECPLFLIFSALFIAVNYTLLILNFLKYL